MVKMTLKATVSDLHSQYQLRVSYDASLVQIWWFRLKSVTSYRADNTNFLKLLVKIVKITLKGKLNEFHRGELSCGQGEVYGRVDRRMDGRRQRQYPIGLKG